MLVSWLEGVLVNMSSGPGQKGTVSTAGSCLNLSRALNVTRWVSVCRVNNLESRENTAMWLLSSLTERVRVPRCRS